MTEDARTVTPFTTTEMSVPAAIIEVLAQAGITKIFGMPGGKTNMIYDALFDTDAVVPVLTREESLGSIMAEVYGRMTGIPGVVMGQTSWLVGNGGAGIIEAHLGSSPMLVLGDLSDNAPFSHQAPYQAATGLRGGWDAAATLRGMTKEVFVANDPVEAVQVTQFAIQHALAGEQGPVAVLYHSRALNGTVGPQSRPRIWHTNAYLPATARVADDAEVRAAAALLDGAERPVIIAGNGVRLSKAYDQLAALARKVGAAVATTGSGKGVFDETDPLAVGVMGNFGEPTANNAVAQADVVLAVGTKLGPSDTSMNNPALIGGEHQTVIQIDVEPLNVSRAVPVEQILMGDAGRVMAQLTELVDDSNAEARAAAVAAHRDTHGFFSRPQGQQASLPMHPQRAIDTLVRHIENDCIVTCDAGENRLFMNRYFQSTGRGDFYQSAASGGMGYSIPAALAAKVAEPSKRVVAVTGDGGFGMCMNGLLTAVEENLPIIVVILNNESLGWVQHSQGDRVVASTLRDFDYAGIAAAMGCDVYRVSEDTEFGKALEAALAAHQDGGDRPIVIEVPTSRDEKYTDIASPMNAWK